MELKELQKFNLKMFDEFIFQEDDQAGFEKNLSKLIEFFNNEIEISINKFNEFEDFKDKLTTYEELVEFTKFYNDVDGDLSTAYYIKEYGETVYYVGEDAELVDLLQTMVRFNLDKEESVLFNKFMVGLVF